MRKLPVFKALGHAFRSTTDNIGFAFHISWPWMLMLLPFNVAINLYLAFNGMQDPQNLTAQSLLLVIPLAIASIVAYCSIAVNWHRYVLLDEVAEGWQRLRIDSLIWRYIGNAILIGLILIAGGVVAFDELISDETMEELSQTSVGASHDSYQYQGKQWALAIDTAAQVSAFRADKTDGSPIFWRDVISEAKKKKVLWAHKPVDVFSTFATLMAQKGKGLFDNGIYVDAEVALEALELMVEVASLVPEFCAKSNPIEIAEILATSNDYAHAVCMYGYSNYSRQGFRQHLVHYDDVPSFDGQSSGSQLGGAGIAISSASSNKPAAGKAAAFHPARHHFFV